MHNLGLNWLMIVVIIRIQYKGEVYGSSHSCSWDKKILSVVEGEVTVSYNVEEVQH